MPRASTTPRAALGLALLLACNDREAASATDTATTGATTSSSTAASGTSTTGATTTDVTTTDAPTTDTPTTGAPGDALQRCQPTCAADRDCTIAGQDIGFLCLAGVCRPPPCTDDAACVRALSGWTEPCAGQDTCPQGHVCIDADGEGRCALTPTMFLACADLGLDERELPTIAGDMTVTVCGVPSATCSAGTCSAPCTSDAACPAQLGHPRCELATGACVCTEDRDCQDTMKPGLIACIAGRCGCRSDMDCTGGTNVDTCYAGACGCASTASCDQQVFDGVTQVCGPA